MFAVIFEVKPTEELVGCNERRELHQLYRNIYHG